MKILIIEDSRSYRRTLRATLEHLGHDVFEAENGEGGVIEARLRRPDAILLDLVLPGRLDGYGVCAELRADDLVAGIPIVIMTNTVPPGGDPGSRAAGLTKGADYFVVKGDQDELLAALATVLRKAVPFSPSVECEVTLILEDGERVGMQVSGKLSLSTNSEDLLHLDAAEYAQNLNPPDRKVTGKDLYRRIFDCRPINDRYKEAVGKVESSRLSLRFSARREYLSVPLECLFDEHSKQGGEYLSLLHPLVRTIRDVQRTRDLIDVSFLNERYRRRHDLRILLIASDASEMPGKLRVDTEIKGLKTVLEKGLSKRGIGTTIEALGSQEATYDRVMRELDHCSYHIVHYAGHGAYFGNAPDKSYLSFWKERPSRGKSGQVERVEVSRLTEWLRDSEVRFVYLNCCYGTATSARDRLLRYDFLGIADGLIHAGVPSVMGFSAPISDNRGKALATLFYQKLIECGQIDVALHRARRELAAQDRNDPTWVAPILTQQG